MRNWAVGNIYPDFFSMSDGIRRELLYSSGCADDLQKLMGSSKKCLHSYHPGKTDFMGYEREIILLRSQNCHKMSPILMD